jgi:hypothetical protein
MKALRKTLEMMLFAFWPTFIVATLVFTAVATF